MELTLTSTLETIVPHFHEIYSSVASIKQLMNSKILEPKTVEDEMSLLVIVQRAFSGYDAVNLLIDQGYFLESLMVIRSIIESYFIFNGLLDHPDEVIKKLKGLSEYNRMRTWETAMKYPQYDRYTENILRDSFHAKRHSIYEFAKLNTANSTMYDIPYRLISHSVHLNYDIIMAQLSYEEGKYYIQKNITPDDIKSSYYTMYHCIYWFFVMSNDRFCMNVDNEVESATNFLSSLLQEMNII